MMMAPQLLLAADVNAATDVQAAVTQQNRSVTGRVVDEKGEPLIGVSIQVKGTKLGTVTDFDGNFKLNAPADATLVISYVGFRTQEIELKGRSDCQVSMVPDDQLLDEVVVVGYGVVKKSDLTGSVGSVKSDVNFGTRLDVGHGESPGTGRRCEHHPVFEPRGRRVQHPDSW